MRVPDARPVRRERHVADHDVVAAVGEGLVAAAEVPLLDARLDDVRAGQRRGDPHRDRVDVDGVEADLLGCGGDPVTAAAARLEPDPVGDAVAFQPVPHRQHDVGVGVVGVQDRAGGDLAVAGPRLLDPVDRLQAPFGAHPLRQARPGPQRADLARASAPGRGARPPTGRRSSPRGHGR